MSQMVYIREIHEQSFVLFTYSNESFRLRDYSDPQEREPLLIREQSDECKASDIREMAARNGNHLIKVPERPIGDYPYWHAQTAKFNRRFGISPPSWWVEWVREHLGAIVASVIAAVIGAAIVAWLGLSK